MLELSGLFVYPIKSLGGISLTSAQVTERGLQHDRRWMLVDAGNRFMTQRELAAMALLQVELEEDGLLVSNRADGGQISIPYPPYTTAPMRVQIWNDECAALPVSALADAWFSAALSTSCRLVYMPDTTERPVELQYAASGEITSFSDDYPFLMIGQSSLDDLNAKLSAPLTMDRFRPNIVFTGGTPYEEDGMAAFTISGIAFYGVKLCARCVVTTIDQQSGAKSKEPLKTLATYRAKNNKIYFGQNLLHKGGGTISIGDKLEVTTVKAPLV